MTLHNHVLHQLQLQVLGYDSPSFADLQTDCWLFYRAAQVQVRIDAEHMWKSILKSLPWFLKWICMWALSGPVSRLVCVLNFPSRIFQVSFRGHSGTGYWDFEGGASTRACDQLINLCIWGTGSQSIDACVLNLVVNLSHLWALMIFIVASSKPLVFFVLLKGHPQS